RREVLVIPLVRIGKRGKAQMAKARMGATWIAQLIESVPTQDRQGSIGPGGGQVCKQGANISSIAREVDQVGILAFCVLQQPGQRCSTLRPNCILLCSHNLIPISPELGGKIVCQALAV